MAKTKLALLYGGKSAEYDVSLSTTQSVINALDLSRYEVYPIHIARDGRWIEGSPISGNIASKEVLQIDVRDGKRKNNDLLSVEFFRTENRDDVRVVFPLLHGPNGEDGTVQGVFELMNVAYVGAGVLASAAAMDKAVMKEIFRAQNLAQTEHVTVKKSDWKKFAPELYEKIENKLGYPCFVKPANLGSSVGISKAKNRGSLQAALRTAFQYDRKVVVESFVDGREIEVGVLGNDEPEVSVAGEIIPAAEFYDYKAKYEDGSTSLVIPANLEKETYETIAAMALQAFRALDCAGLARVDFFVRRSDGKVLINELNTMPGFTPYSMFPLLWEKSGVPYTELINRLVELAVERHEEKQQIKHTR